MTQLFVKGKKGMGVKTIIYFIIAIVVIYAVVTFFTRSSSDVMQQPQLIADDVSALWAWLLDLETREEEALRLKREMHFLNFTGQLTKFMDGCLGATNAPCLCTLKGYDSFQQNFVLTIAKRKDDTYYSIPTSTVDVEKSIPLRNPGVHKGAKGLKLCSYDKSVQESSAFHIYAEGGTLYLQDGKTKRSLGSGEIRLYKPANAELCFLPEGVAAPTQPASAGTSAGKPLPVCDV